MKKTLMAAGLTAMMSTAAAGETIGVSMALFDDNFLTVLRNGMSDYVDTLDDVDIQILDAENDVGEQLNQIENFAASGVDAMIVNPVDTSATAAMTQAAASAGVPLVYVNRQPVNLSALPDNQAFVGSNEVESGTLETFEICKLLRGQGLTDGAQAVVLMGELSNQAAQQRTADIHDVLELEMCNFIEIVEEQTANWRRTEAADLMSNWLSAGTEFDAVISNNDEMAIGAIQAMQNAGMDVEEIVVGGVDATRDALLQMQQGNLDVTVFQNSAGQGEGAVDTALALARGEDVARTIYVPFELVTPENMDDYMQAN
ncbi:rhizopine-binding protein [Rhodobacteraceae bacterium WD3A24]|nr:rhizopine-binding protein [Rhodobacteraceae bacterium WD3A24]